MKKPTVADLMAEIEALKREIALLRIAPVVVHHHHHESRPLFVPQPADPRLTWGACSIGAAAGLNQNRLGMC